MSVECKGMRSIICTIVCVVVLVSGLLAQIAKETGKLVTVCDILSNPATYAGKTVAVLGRADCSPNLTDTSCFLAEDRCTRPVVTHDHVWPTKIWVQPVYGDEFSSQLAKEKTAIDESAMTEKLVLVRRSTQLGFHKEIVVSTKDKTARWANLRDEWGIAYGLVVFRPKLKPGDNCSSGDRGCGGWNETPVMIVVRTELGNLTTFSDDKYLPQPKP